MENIFTTNIYLFGLALVFAILEVQIEGADGWAKNLPTWRSKKQVLGKVLTGYHLSIFTLVLMIFHLPFAMGLPFSFDQELKTLSLFFMFVVVWDFLWFVLNPHYPLKNFKKEFISWHKRWYLMAPADYYFGIVLSFLVILPIFLNHVIIIQWWFINIILFILETILMIILVSSYSKFKR